MADLVKDILKYNKSRVYKEHKIPEQNDKLGDTSIRGFRDFVLRYMTTDKLKSSKYP